MRADTLENEAPGVQSVPGAGTGTTEVLAHHAAGLDYGKLPTKTVDAARRLLLDGIGCLIAGVAGGPGRVAYQAVEPMLGDGGNATIVIAGRRASAREAALVNGITLYSVGVNDFHKPSGSHPGGCVIPAVLAAGEWQRSGGADMLAAMVAGYDIMGRIGRAMIPSHRDRGFHPTGTFGPFGTAAAVGRLLGLDAAHMTAALGVAGSHAAGTKAFHTDGSLTMVYHAGRAASDGIAAALFARAGFTGPRTVIEDPDGFAAAGADTVDLSLATRGLGTMFEVEDTTFRPYYGCGLTIGASGGTASILKRSGRSPADVEQVRVRSNSIVAHEVGDEDPRTLLAARLSMQFNLALVIERGDVYVGDVTEQQLWEPGIRRLMPRIGFDVDDAMPRYGCEVAVRFKDGGEERLAVPTPKGDPLDTLSWEEAVVKFRELVSRVATPEAAERVVDRVRMLENSDGAALMAEIVAAAQSRKRAG